MSTPGDLPVGALTLAKNQEHLGKQQAWTSAAINVVPLAVSCADHATSCTVRRYLERQGWRVPVQLDGPTADLKSILEAVQPIGDFFTIVYTGDAELQHQYLERLLNTGLAFNQLLVAAPTAAAQPRLFAESLGIAFAPLDLGSEQLVGLASSPIGSMLTSLIYTRLAALLEEETRSFCAGGAHWLLRRLVGVGATTPVELCGVALLVMGALTNSYSRRRHLIRAALYSQIIRLPDYDKLIEESSQLWDIKSTIKELAMAEQIEPEQSSHVSSLGLEAACIKAAQLILAKPEGDHALIAGLASAVTAEHREAFLASVGQCQIHVRRWNHAAAS